jgi:hypothetical protein
MMLADDGRGMDSRIWIICLANLVLATYLAWLAWQLLELRRGLRRWRLALDALQRGGQNGSPAVLLLLKQTALGSLRCRQQGQLLQRSLRQMRQWLGLLAFSLTFWQQTRQPRQR